VGIRRLGGGYGWHIGGLSCFQSPPDPMARSVVGRRLVGTGGRGGRLGLGVVDAACVASAAGDAPAPAPRRVLIRGARPAPAMPASIRRGLAGANSLPMGPPAATVDPEMRTLARQFGHGRHARKPLASAADSSAGASPGIWAEAGIRALKNRNI